MITSETVESVIFKALHTLNAERGPDEQIPVTPTTPLFGADSMVDSLGLVSLIVDVETTLNTDHGLEVSLADDRAMSRPKSPYTSVATLKEFVLELTRGA